MAVHLPAGRGQRVDEDDLARDLLVGERLGDVLAELGLELLGAFGVTARNHECADEVTAALQVADPDDGRGDDRVVTGQRALDVERPERPAARA